MNSYKLILVGESAVGKTSLVRRYMYNDFMDFHAATIVTSFVSKKFDNFRMDIWDSAGQERFQSLVQMYFRGTQTALVLFSAQDFNSFNQVKYWVNAVREKTGNTDVQIIVVENKIDVENRTTNEAEVNQYCTANNLPYVKVSAKTGEGVEKLFDLVVKRAETVESELKEGQVDVAKTNEKPKKCC
ncbi:Rab1a [Hexamita inflata]|uniref:Rab1a n=1 Tax=Hexamita inflata TaxID=28002 RepID=A0AA86TL06_9EUKA|nr:Rab1a [Hexamita inflata]CAI9920752.1 Rab1a [Hexamita inflata]CAI9951314.1 Rab1a [Hexamita inflata]